jgi:hypothetical protein
MDGRHYRESLRRLRLFAGEAPLSSEQVQQLMRPLIDEWRPVPVPNLKEALMPSDPNLRLSDASLADLTARIRAIGMNLNKGGQKGIDYHNNFVRKLAMLADTFDCRGWTESAALFDDPEAVAEAPVQLAGRVDVLWARNRLPVVVFEIDSTVKARSFQKLKEAAAAHKLWVYFGKDIWGFRTFLQKEDPGREVIPVIIPRTFIPSFADEGAE